MVPVVVSEICPRADIADQWSRPERLPARVPWDALWLQLLRIGSGRRRQRGDAWRLWRGANSSERAVQSDVIERNSSGWTAQYHRALKAPCLLRGGNHLAADPWPIQRPAPDDRFTRLATPPLPGSPLPRVLPPPPHLCHALASYLRISFFFLYLLHHRSVLEQRRLETEAMKRREGQKTEEYARREARLRQKQREEGGLKSICVCTFV